MSKVFQDIHTAFEHGMTVLVGGFGICEIV